MTRRRFVLAWLLSALAVLLLTACQPVHPVEDQGSAAQGSVAQGSEPQMSESDAKEVVSEFLDAWGAKDIDGVSATLADDVIHSDTHPAPGVAGKTIGKENVTAYYQGNFGAPGYEMEYANLAADGDTASWTAKEALDPSLTPPNFPFPIESHYSATVDGGKITSIQLVNDPEWLEKLYAAIPQEAIDPVSVLQLWTKAFNERDEETVRQFMADDITFMVAYGTPDDAPLRGKDEVAGLIEGSDADNFMVELGALESDGATVSGNYSAIGDEIRALDIGPEVGTIEAVVENGVLKSIMITPDAEFTKKLDEAKGKS